jgi:hypothetical protein
LIPPVPVLPPVLVLLPPVPVLPPVPGAIPPVPVAPLLPPVALLMPESTACAQPKRESKIKQVPLRMEIIVSISDVRHSLRSK